MAIICPYGGKCKNCKHYRLDPERSYAEDPRDRYSCYLNEDLKGEERREYLKKIEDHK